MKKLWYCFLKDLKLSVKGLYFYVEFGMAVIYVAVLLLAVPLHPVNTVKVYASIDISGMNAEDLSAALNRQNMSVTKLNSRDEVVAKLNKDRNSVGLNVYIKDGSPVFEYILQGYENQKFRNIIEAAIKTDLAKDIPGYTSSVDVTTLGANLERLNGRVNLLPVYLTLNVAFMGLFIIASYIFLDKEEGTIKALAVTPASVWQYLLSKLLIMLVTGIVTSFIVVFAVAGAGVDYLLLFLAITVYSCFGSALGLFIASFFDTMSKAMGWLYLSVIVLAFASLSYFMPAFSPLVIRILPSYPMLFSFREILLGSGDKGSVLISAAGFFAAAAVLFFLADRRFRKTITV
jgi:hypothetical protein